MVLEKIANPAEHLFESLSGMSQVKDTGGSYRALIRWYMQDTGGSYRALIRWYVQALVLAQSPMEVAWDMPLLALQGSQVDTHTAGSKVPIVQVY